MSDSELLLVPELIKLELPRLYVKRTILNSKYQGSPFPAIYCFKDDDDRNLYTGYTKDSRDRTGCHKEFVKDEFKTIMDGIPHTHIYQVETQSSYIAKGVESFVHHFYPPVYKDKRKNVIHQLSLEKEYNDCGEIKELKLHELLGIKKNIKNGEI